MVDVVLDGLPRDLLGRLEQRADVDVRGSCRSPVLGLVATVVVIGLNRDDKPSTAECNADRAALLRAEEAFHTLERFRARSLLDRRLPNDVAEVLDRHGLPANRLVLEISKPDMPCDTIAGSTTSSRINRTRAYVPVSSRSISRV